jgi:uncharacterized membrane protein YgcG
MVAFPEGANQITKQQNLIRKKRKSVNSLMKTRKYIAVWLVAAFAASMIVTVFGKHCWWYKSYICAAGAVWCSNNNPIAGYSRLYNVSNGFLDKCESSSSGFFNCDDVPADCVRQFQRTTYDSPDCQGIVLAVESGHLTSQGTAASLWDPGCSVASNKNQSGAGLSIAGLFEGPNSYVFVTLVSRQF